MWSVEDWEEKKRKDNYIAWKVVQGEASHANDNLHWSTVISAIICIHSIFIFCRHGFTFMLKHGTSSLIIMYMAEKSQVNLFRFHITVTYHKHVNELYTRSKKLDFLTLFWNSNGSTASLNLFSDDNNPWWEVYIGLCLHVKVSCIICFIDRSNDVNLGQAIL